MARQPEPQVLTAAAGPPGVVDVYTSSPEARALRQDWQSRAWVYYDLIPEVRFAATFVGNALSRVRLYAAKRPPRAGLAPTELSGDDPISEAVEALRDETGTQRSLLRDLSTNLFVEGECYLLGESPSNFKVLSNDEIRFPGGVDPQTGRPLAQYREAPFMDPKPIPSDALLMRVWKPHPRWSRLADSAMRTVQDDCEKLILLSKAEKATTRSRFAASGILFIPQELVPPAMQSQDRNADPMMANPFYTAIASQMMAAAKDEGHPANLVPIMMIGPAAVGASIRYITLERPLDKLSAQLKDSAIRRIAVAFDLPTDYLMGLGDVNHWSAAAIRDDAFSAHLQPFIELICDSLTIGYLHPVLRRNGVDEKELQEYVIWYDARELISHPDQQDAAIQAYDRGAINAKTFREALGYTEESVMSEDEWAKFVGFKLADPKMAVTGKPTEPPAPGGGGAAPSGDAGGRPVGSIKGPKVSGNNVSTPPSKSQRRVSQTATTSQNSTQAKTVRASGAPDTSELGYRLAMIDIDLMQKLRVLAESSLQRAAEKLGARLRSKLAANHALTAAVNSVPNGDLAAFLGRQTVERLGYDDDLALSMDLDAPTDLAGDMIESSLTTSLDAVNDYAPNGGDWSWMAQSVTDQVAAAKVAFKDTLLGLLREKLYGDLSIYQQADGEGDNLLIPPSRLREVIQIGGGRVSAELPNLGGTATGKLVLDYMQSVGIPTEGWIWLYSPQIRRPRGPFNPHLQLDGLVFQTPTDPELEVPDGKAFRFLKRSHMFPGDHYGCMCVVAPYTGPNFGEPVPLS